MNLAGYDEVLEEDRDAVSPSASFSFLNSSSHLPLPTSSSSRHQNQTRDALLLFQTIVSNPIFLSKTFLLFLNKCDIFDSKVASGLSPINPSFTDYAKEDEGDVMKAREFFRRKFLRLAKARESGTAGPPVIGVRRLDSNGMIYSHYSTAVDKSEFEDASTRIAFFR